MTSTIASRNPRNPRNPRQPATGRRLLFKALAAVSAAVTLASCANIATTTADAVYLGGKVITVDQRFSIAQAIAVKDGKFVAVGTSEEIRKYVGSGTRVVDLQGKTVIPGLMDSHSHMIGAGTAETTAQVIKAKTVADAQAIIADFIKSKKIPAGEWVQTSRWHPPSQLREQRYLTRQELDAVSPNNPLFVETVGHFAMANTKALQLAGISRTTQDPVGGKIFRDANGDATGVLEETAMDLVSNKIPKPSFDQLVTQLTAAQRIYNESGITSTVDAALTEEQIAAYFALAERGRSTVRTGVKWISRAATAAEFEQMLKRAKYKDNSGNDWVRLAGIKIVADGGMTLKSARVREAYADDAHNHGTLALDPEAYKQSVVLANRYGWRVGTHAVGDAAVDLVLDAYAAADKQKSIMGGRFIVIHGSLMTKDQIVRAKQLGVRVDAQNIFMWDKAATVERYMGPVLANRAVPSRWLLDTLGVEGTAAGTDNPVNILNPFVGLYVMVTRKDPNGKVYGADQALTREEALRLYTNAGPYYTFEEKKKGSIEAGKFADMVVLSADYLSVPDAQIKDIKPLQTIVDGKVVYDAAARSL
ncbi:amidohydrolase [Variovorax sp. PBS-H4]|uniref:amidohydrolase n=1 Tax=Variovorax sp. PBS-H4 TaxID=434008 RepID=UPI0013A585BB|nr:amidohydrolase [Variovorax sp. PBS-H4]